GNQRVFSAVTTTRTKRRPEFHIGAPGREVRMMRTIFDTKALYASLTDEQREQICTAAIDREIMSHGRDVIQTGQLSEFTAVEELCERMLRAAVTAAFDPSQFTAAAFPLPSCAASRRRPVAPTRSEPHSHDRATDAA